jgi:hypothetical protein
MKSNLAARLYRRRHESPNGIDDRGDLLVMLADAPLQLGKFVSELAI